MTGLATVLVLASALGAGAAPELRLTTRRGSACEERKKAQLERLARQYELGRYTLTRQILIEQGAIAHSMPVLTLNCRFLDDDDRALSQFLHEQGHWVLSRHRPELPRLFQELRRAIPDLPSEPPRGSGGERDSYLHLAVILLEWQALEQLVGQERARAVLEFKSVDHYTAIYAAVLSQRPRLVAILERQRISF